jgi:hypothetical protein
MRVYFKTEKVSESEYRKSIWTCLTVGVILIVCVLIQGGIV